MFTLNKYTRAYAIMKLFKILIFSLFLVTGCAEKGIILQSASIRPTLKENGTSVLYFELKNNTGTDLRLLGITTLFTTKVELHETYEKEGLAGMRAIEPVVIKNGETVLFQPGAKHVMLSEINKDLVKGSEEELTFNFENLATKQTERHTFKVRVTIPAEL